MALNGFLTVLVRLLSITIVLFLAACGGGGGGGGDGGAADVPSDSETLPPAAIDCTPLDLVVGEVITVSDTAQLVAAVTAINDSGGNRTVLIEDGDYELSALLHIHADNVVIRGRSGNRDRVILHGQNMAGGLSHIFLVAASHVTIADLSLGQVYYHAIQVQGENGAGHLRVHNVRIFDTGEQMLKGSYDGETGSDDGVVECSLFEYTQAFGPQYYIGGIDVHHGRNWVVRGNTFKNIRSPEDRAAEHAIHFWSDSETPLIEKNRIINCDRGIGLGLGTRGCTGGLIRNNTIYGDDLGLNSDVGIGLETARNIRVYNNTIYFAHDYPWAIEYRWAASTGNLIVNNLTNASIASRDGGSATVRRNITDAVADWFSNPASGDLHLSRTINAVVDAGEALIDVQEDMDGDLRPIGSGYDIGADEF